MSQSGGRVVWPQSVNRNGYLTVNRWARESAWAHTFMHHYALWAGLVVLALLLVIGYLLVRRLPDAIHRVTFAFLTGVASLVALGLAQLVNHAVAEPRPYLVYPHALVLVAKANDYSFPSDHGVVVGAFIVGLFFVKRIIGWLAAFFGLFLCFARIYVGAHFPSDVVAGVLLGALICAVVLGLLTRPVEALARWLSGTPLRPLVTASRPVAQAQPHSHAAG
ncbi:MAG: phosphatase PAP2 family protein [Mycobacteriales bacterium]